MVNITDEMKLGAEKSIRSNEKIFNYRTSQWEVQHICKIFWNWVNDFTKWELFVPTYQREYVWSDELKYKFIESLFLNIPIPYVFINENSEDLNMEIIDWYQRIRTIYEFYNDLFELKSLDKLKELEWFKFSDLPDYAKTRFYRKQINVVIFDDLELWQKQEMFSRINTTSDILKSMEKRKWALTWDFYDFMKELSEIELFKKLCPLSKIKLNREENIELILRFFAYTEKFQDYKWSVDSFLTSYMKDKNYELEIWNKIEILSNMKDYFNNMLNFINLNFTYWFRKSWRENTISSRVYFEALSVWVWLALNEWVDLNILIIKKLLKDKNFEEIIWTDWANATKKFKARINAVKEALLYSKLPSKL